jgi:hypothetical protein
VLYSNPALSGWPLFHAPLGNEATALVLLCQYPSCHENMTIMSATTCSCVTLLAGEFCMRYFDGCERSTETHTDTIADKVIFSQKRDKLDLNINMTLYILIDLLPFHLETVIQSNVTIGIFLSTNRYYDRTTFDIWLKIFIFHNVCIWYDAWQRSLWSGVLLNTATAII